MPTNFLSLPSEIRNDIYKHLLVLEDPIECPRNSWLQHSEVRALTTGLLLTNKTVHHEASSFFYAQNRFSFFWCTLEHVESFFEQIGRTNTNWIRHIYIEFPEFKCLDQLNVSLEEDSVQILEKIRDECSQLSTIKTSVMSIEYRLDALDCPKAATKAITLVDTHFRAIPSLEEIIVEVYEDSRSGYARNEMKRRGWTITVKEWGSDFDGFYRYDGNDSYDYGYDEGYEYDIDSVSDYY